MKRLLISLALIFYIDCTQECSTTLDALKEHNKYSPNNALRLHLGCGQRYLPGYINIDFPSSEHTVQAYACADFFANITELQFPPNTVDEVRSHHVFEHFTRQQTLAMLCAWHNWLKIDGIIVIETPDFQASIEQLLSRNYSYTEKQAIMRHVFGSHEAHWAIHCDGWYQEKFEHILSALGYSIMSISSDSYLLTRNITVIARKINQLNSKELMHQAHMILQESLVCPEETTMLRIWQTDFEHAFYQMVLS